MTANTLSAIMMLDNMYRLMMMDDEPLQLSHSQVMPTRAIVVRTSRKIYASRIQMLGGAVKTDVIDGNDVLACIKPASH